MTLVRLAEQDYRQASFLDARLLTPTTQSRTLPWADLAAPSAALPESADFIFHIGHVGSTLLARLMGAHSNILALREPMVLRTFAQTGRHDLAPVLKLLSRTFRPGQRALVKATSFVSEIAPQIMARAYGPKAIFMFVPAEIYLATILGGPNSRQEARMLGVARYNRLRARKPIPQPASEGELIAMSWACEMTALQAVTQSERILWLDFDRFLADPANALGQCFRHIGVDATDAEIATILAGPDMRTYSKAQEYDYDAKLRQDVLAQARAEHGAEIARGMAWLERNGFGEGWLARA
ncbi:MAG TPA: hypothetical protein VGF56_11695 [Rhizomicrobium sp.]